MSFQGALCSSLNLESYPIEVDRRVKLQLVNAYLPLTNIKKHVYERLYKIWNVFETHSCIVDGYQSSNTPANVPCNSFYQRRDIIYPTHNLLKIRVTFSYNKLTDIGSKSLCYESLVTISNRLTAGSYFSWAILNS